MHREISHADQTFASESRLSLYLFTAIIGLLTGLDLWVQLGLPAVWPDRVKLPFVNFEVRLALVAAVIGGARILYGSLESLLDGRIGADLALAIATIAAILYKDESGQNQPLVAAEIVFIGLLGECLEHLTFARTQRAIRKLVEVFPRRCWLLRDGQEVRVLTSEVKVSDRVVVKPGGRVPVDGVVVEGRSEVDTSALTGESLPCDKGPGDEVLAGSVNQLGALTIEARRVAEQTVAGRVIELTSRALKDKAPLERTADKLARWFLPAVLGLAALTFLISWMVSGELGRSVPPTLAVLVVACPCALILATPAAVIAALGRLAGTGVLIKGGSALERLAAINAFAFDKTGTLTEGRLELGDVVGLNDTAPDEVLRAAATAEQRSEHLLARLITQEASARQLTLEPVEDFLAHPGAGVTAKVRVEKEARQAAAAEGPVPSTQYPVPSTQQPTPGEEHSVLGIPPVVPYAEHASPVVEHSALGTEYSVLCTLVVGTRRLLEEQGVVLPPEALAVLEQFDAGGQTALLVARDGVVLGVIGARDRVRPEAKAVLDELRALGINDIALLTGDRAAAARAVAEGLGVTEVHAELLPQQKAEFVSNWSVVRGPSSVASEHITATLQRTTDHGPRTVRSVAMVGDGINDAPALARADVGLAIGSGTDVAAEAGDIVFMGDPLRSLPLLVRLSRETVRIIRQNILIFAFGVNLAGIVLTAWLWPWLFPKWRSQSPVAAVIYHQIGSLAVLLNAMRLLLFERAFRNPIWLKVKHLWQRLDLWLEHNLNLDEGLHWLGHKWKPVLAVVGALLLAAYALSGLTLVGPDEVAVVRRFGQTIDEDLGPGLYWRWPWPVEQVTRIDADRIRTLRIDFRPNPQTAGTASSDMLWSTPHGGRDPDEAVLITGDGNLVEMQATVRYRIRNPRAYLFEVADPEGLLRAAAESVLREAVAGQPFSSLLTVDRDAFQKDVLIRLERRCRELGADGLGILLDGFSVQDLHPPLQLVPHYYEVTRNREIRDRLITDAQTYRLSRVKEAESQKDDLLRKAQTAAAKTVRDAKAERDGVLARYYVWLHNPTLTEFTLLWETRGKALGGRDKVILDADKVRGRRLLFFDPDQPFVPPPAVFLPEGTSFPPRQMHREGGEGQ